MNQLSSVLTVLAVTWAVCLLPIGIAVMMLHPSNSVVLVYAFMGVVLFVAIAVLLGSQTTTERRQQDKEDSS